MFTRKKKMESNSGVKEPENRLLRLLRSNDVPKGSLVSLENTDQEDACSADRETIRNAMLEVEYQNARALQAFQNSQRLF